MSPSRHIPIVPVVVLAVSVTMSHAGALLDPFVALPWGPTGTPSEPGFGEFVATAGDVDGDGFGDVVVGHPLAQNSAAFEGAAHVYLGSAQGSSLVPDWSYFSGQARGFAGSAVASAGDVNRDGFADLLVGIPAWDTPADSNAGKVAVFHGGPSGLPLTPTYELVSPTPLDDQAFGTAVATAGDVNGDGFADVLVGANFLDGGFNRGVVYVFHGSASGLGATPARFWFGPPGQNSQFGRILSSAGDVNGDGFADVILGAPGQATPFTSGGAASLYLGTPSGAADVPDTTLLGTAIGVQLGLSVSLAGDVNGDGYGDVLIGSPGFNGGAGRAQVFHGGPTGIVSSETILTPENPPGDGFGRHVATLGDLDGDGFADFAIGAFHAPSFRGRIGVYRGGRSATRYVGEILSRGDDGFFGSTFGTTGDADGDGRSEILVGTEDMSVVPGQLEGRTFQFRAPRILPALAPGWPRAGAQAGSRYGTAVAIVPHFDSFSDRGKLVIGDPGFDLGGRVSIHDGSTIAGVTLGESGSSVSSTNAEGLGTRIVDAGDMNGDGRSDFAVSSPTVANGPAIQAGAVRLIPGANVPFPLALPVVLGATNFDRVGSALAGRGDVNGDGFHDLLVGAGGWDEPGLADCGKVFLFFGDETGLGNSPWTRLGTQVGQGLGAGVALADLDADGYTDVILGSSSPTFGSTAPGKVEVHYGGPSGPSNTPGLLLTPSSPHVSYGLSVASIGDVNADGISDLGVGAPTEDGRGVVRIYQGSLGRSQTSIPIVTLRGTQGGGRFGEAMAGGGDVDGDGRGDLAIGEPGWDGGLTDEGRLHLFFGAPNVPEIPAGFVVESNLLAAELGASLSPLRDVNADGLADVVAGAPGGSSPRVYPFLGGGSPGPVHRLRPREGGITRLHPARMSFPEEIPVVFFSHTAGGGRARIKFQLEHALHDEPFTGTPTMAFPPSFDSGTTIAVQTGIDILPGQPGRAFRVRGRWTTPSPFFPRSRWVTPEAHASGDHDAWMTGTAVGVPPPGDAAGGSLRILGVSPNPAFRGAGASRIAFTLPRGGRVTIDVLDLRGARVRRVLDEEKGAGRSSAAWDGRDEAGRAVAAGVYFVVVRSGEARDRAKVVRLP
jgi:hypothetical protein